MYRQEAEEKLLKEEKERREHEEYLALRDQFTVDESGEAEAEADLSVWKFCFIFNLFRFIKCCTFIFRDL